MVGGQIGRTWRICWHPSLVEPDYCSTEMSGADLPAVSSQSGGIVTRCLLKSKPDRSSADCGVSGVVEPYKISGGPIVNVYGVICPGGVIAFIAK